MINLNIFLVQVWNVMCSWHGAESGMFTKQRHTHTHTSTHKYTQVHTSTYKYLKYPKSFLYSMWLHRHRLSWTEWISVSCQTILRLHKLSR